MDDPASKGHIRKFVKAYKGQLNVSEIDQDLDSFATFNEFFYRRLKPGARPIADQEDDGVLVSAADSRLTAYENVADAKMFWIKVQRYLCDL
jgi:phosphatidylserine decarboxylase